MKGLTQLTVIAQHKLAFFIMCKWLAGYKKMLLL